MSKTTATNAGPYAHLLHAPRAALDAMVRGEVLGGLPPALVEARARQLARQIIAAAKRARIA